MSSPKIFVPSSIDEDDEDGADDDEDPIAALAAILFSSISIESSPALSLLSAADEALGAEVLTPPAVT